MKKLITSPLLLLSIASLAQNKDPRLTEIWQPEPKIVSPGKTAADAPADAVVLFNGKDLAEWQTEDGKPAKWKVESDAVTVVKGTGVIKTKRAFGDCQLHVEWRTPAEVKGEGQGRGNSGIFLMGLYELQVLDSYNNRTYSNGQAGSIYKQTAPLANASRKPGEWQTYDIIFTAPRFNKDSSVKSQGRITVLHNGVLVQNSTAIWGATQYIGIATNTWHKEKEPIVLQDHGDAVSFRNIWIRELE
ncbi:3-keto-disaccharide hydrolase [Niabella sp. 22666]|uniref:3-keto-disaccharide hydrolase n=1 Tax=Niabella sp. 22666 TaxID=3453954 RepID=UPI003F85DE0E